MNRLLLIILASISRLAFAQDSGQYLDGSSFYQEIEQIKTDDTKEQSGANIVAPNAVAPKQSGFTQDELLKGTAGSTSFDPNLAGGEAVVTSDEKVLSSKRREAISNFGINYFMAGDTEFSGDNGIFKKSFIDDPEAIHVGPIMLGWERLLGRSAIVPLINFNAGLNFYRGRGVFIADGSYSTAFFNLWLLPLDLGLGLGLRLWDAVSFKAVAGPSVMGLIQVRNDLDSSEKGKTRRQIGTGYSATGKFQINLSRMFPSWGLEYYRDYQATGAYLDFIARVEKYANFQDDVEVNSTLLGLGFSFDLL